MTSPVSSAIVASGGAAGSSPLPATEAFVGCAVPPPGAAPAAVATPAVAAPGSAGLPAAGEGLAKPATRRGGAMPFADALALEWAAALAAGAPDPGGDGAPRDATDAGEADAAADGGPADDPAVASATPATPADPAAGSAMLGAAAMAAPSTAPLPSEPAGEPSHPTETSAPLGAALVTNRPAPATPPAHPEVRPTTPAPTSAPAAPRTASGVGAAGVEDERATAADVAATPTSRTVVVEAGTHVTLELLRVSTRSPRSGTAADIAAAPAEAIESVRAAQDGVEPRERGTEPVGPRIERTPIEVAEPPAHAAAAAPSTARESSVAVDARSGGAAARAAGAAPSGAPPRASESAREPTSPTRLASRGPAQASAPSPSAPPVGAGASSESDPADPDGSPADAAHGAQAAPPSASTKHPEPTGAESARASRAPSASHRDRPAAGRDGGDESLASEGAPHETGTPERDPAEIAIPRRAPTRRAEAGAPAAPAPRSDEAALHDSPAATDAARRSVAGPATPLPERAATDLANANPDPAQGAEHASSLRMTLEPPDGGRLEVRLEVRGESVHASIVTGDDTLRSQLSSGRDDLREHLRQQHLDLGGLDVSTGAGGHGTADRQAERSAMLSDDTASPVTVRPASSARAVLDRSAAVAAGPGGARRALDVTV